MKINQNDPTRQAIILGALLHDIGKFAQRAEVQLSPQSKSMEASLCPVYKGCYFHKHVLWTNQFFEKYKNWFPFNIFTQITENPIDNCANFACYHHNADTPLQAIIQEADRLSAGMDRLERDIEDEIRGGEIYKRVRLHSIFEKIDLGNNPSKPDRYRYELNPLTPLKNIFPELKEKLKPPEGQLLVSNYLKLWEEFIRDFQKLPQDDFNTFLNSLVSLLERYTWCIPSSTQDFPDISLYDHSKTTAAIAACLYEYHHQRNTFVETSIRDKNIKKFILIGGDLSGIQKYIFSLSHTNVEGVSKRLRARSFYLSALSTVTSHYLLKQLKLPLLCNIVDAGGRFILLAPNGEETRNSLAQCYKEISSWYRKVFAGELVLNLNWDLELNGDDFKVEKFSEILDQLNQRMEEKKSHKLKEVLVSNSSWLEDNFIIQDYNYRGNRACRNCEKLPPVENDNFCQQCFEQEKVGRWLTDSRIVTYSHNEPRGDEFISFFDGKYYLSFQRDATLNAKEYYLIEELYKPEHRLSNYVDKYLANYIPLFSTKEEITQLCSRCKEQDKCNVDKSIGTHKSFGCIATEAIKEDNAGSAMLGVLRADVDRLGLIFSLGLEKMSISRHATLSRMLNLFFAGYLEERMHQKYKNVYTVYSGGDDLFLISDWGTIIELSNEINNDFRKFSCENEDVSISSGITTIKPNFPIRRAADLTEEILKKSKDEGRNRLTLFDTTIEWRNLAPLLDFGKVIDDEFNRTDSKISSSFLYRLLKYHLMYLETLKDKFGMRNLLYHSLMSYDVERNVKEKEDIDGKERIINQQLINELQRLYKIPPDSRLMKNLKIPLFWVLYKNRRKK
ncbi:type III-A CRISPR-associated protein Cas10/Csm1 [Thermodesulfovibrionales bacterium]|nr:type III-A CRISPR-associated protein Cas10/Csm1 [Thermodesulfovibrionales bacterium]